MSTPSDKVASEIASLQRIGDRLTLTPNENFATTADAVVPKLLVMMNNGELRSTVIPILSACLKRMKQLRIRLSLGPLIALIHPSYMPFACNFAVTFVDAVLKLYSEDKLIGSIDPNSLNSLLVSISMFPVMSPQNNSLCLYILDLIEIFPTLQDIFLSNTSEESETMRKVSNVLCDWFLDVALLQPLIKDSIGSIVPGLSKERVSRLTQKRNEWKVSDMKDIKLKLINSVTSNLSNPNNLIKIEYMSVILISLSVDGDSEVSLAARNKFIAIKSILNVKETNSASRLIELICSLVINTSDRSALRDDVAHALISWINREIPWCYEQLSKQLFATGFSLLLSFKTFNYSSLRLQDAVLEMMVIVANAVTVEVLETEIPSYLSSLKSILLFGLAGLQGRTGVVQDDQTLQVVARDVVIGRLIRKKCYSIVTTIAPKCPVQIAADTELVVNLFRLIDYEDVETISNLFEALGSLRECIEKVITSGLSSAATLKDFLIAERETKEPKKRMAILQWMRSICGWDAITIFSFLKSSDFPNEDVSLYILKEMDNLKFEFTSNLMSAKISKSNDVAANCQTEDSRLKSLLALIEVLINESLLSPEYLSKLGFIGRMYDILCEGLKFYGFNIPLLESFNSPNHEILSYNPQSDKSNHKIQSISDQITIYADKIISILLRILESGISSSMTNSGAIVAMLKAYVILLSQPDHTSLGKCIQTTPTFLRCIKDHSPSTDLADADSLNMYVLGSLASEVLRLYAQHALHELDLNYLAQLKRSLFLKLDSSVNQENRVLTLNAITCLISAMSSGYSSIKEPDLISFYTKLLYDFDEVIFKNSDIKSFNDSEFVVFRRFMIQVPSNSDPLQALISKVVDFGALALPSLIKSKEVGNLIEVLTRGSVLNFVTKESSMKLWSILFDETVMVSGSEESKFSLAEGLLRMSLSSQEDIESIVSLSPLSRLINELSRRTTHKVPVDEIPPLLRLIITYIEFKSKNGSLAIKSFCSVWTLVIVKFLNDLVGKSNTFLLVKPLISKEFTLWSLYTLLRMLEENSLFIQDMCCLGLCHIFNLAYSLDSHDRSNDTSSKDSASKENANMFSKGLHSLVATEVISIITREKRNIAPAGFSVAGESASQNGGTNQEEESRAISELIREALNSASENGVSLRGENQADRDALLEAAYNMIRQIPQDTANMTNNQAQNSTEQRYLAIYTTICKIARKSGDPALLFAALALIKKDPNHSCIGSSQPVKALYDLYKPSSIEFDRTKIKQLIPVIYQHRHDPTQSIREIMKILWDNIVFVEHPQALWLYESDILDYLVSNLKSPQWRDRESACNSLEVYLPTRPWSSLRKRIDVLWTCALNLIDDIRDSTRAAGLKFAKSLSEQILQRCDKNLLVSGVPDVETIRDTVDTFMFLVFEKGFFKSNQVSIMFSLGIVIRIVEISGPYLSRWLPELISVLVESMSALEPGNLQYLQFHTSRMQLSGDDLESFRLQLAQNSPIQEALNKCLQSLDDKNIPDVIQSLSFHLQRGVGLATRVSAAQSISFVAERYPRIIRDQKYSVKAFHLIIDTLTSSPFLSAAIKKSFTNAQGALAKILPSEAVIVELNQLLTQYQILSRDENKIGSIVASCIHEIIKRGGESIPFNNAIWTDALAMAFVGSFDTDDDSKNTWTALWGDILTMSGSGTKSIAVVRCLGSIVNSIHCFINDLSWNRRVQGLQALNDVLLTLPAQQIAPNIGLLVQNILLMIPGHVWKGKHNVLTTLAMLVNKCTHRLDSTSPITAVMTIQSEAISTTLSGVSNESMSDNSAVVVTLDDIDRDQDSTSELKDTIADSDIGAYDSIHEATTSASQTIMMTPDSLKKFSHWRLSIRAIAWMFVKECDRSCSDRVRILDKDYPILCAKAMQTLPWSFFATCLPGLVVDLLPSLCTQAEIATTESIIEGVLLVSGENLSSKRPMTELASNLKTATIESKTKLKNTAAMFGSRYGSQPLKPVQYGSAKPSNKRPLDVSSIQSRVGEASESSTESNVKDLSEQKSSNREPAYRLKFVECITSGWVTESSIVDLSESQKIVYASVKQRLISWVLSGISKEVWSIRAAGLKLLSRIIKQDITSNSSTRDASIAQIIETISKAVEEKKYSKVRVAGLEALESLCLSNLSHEVLTDYKESAKAIARAGTSDSEPLVIELATRIQSILK